ncbi:AsnB Asparagine synthase (glutamine-hydrolyzing) [Candidatus Nanopelagicaceae bacterium]
MCGIVGVISNNSLEIERNAAVSKMISLIHHRGPDDSGFSSHNPVTIGMVRLSIVDLVKGKQPMRIENCKKDLEVVFNGEIYNHKDLRAELHLLGHKFQSSHSDTEVILHAFEEWGNLAFSRLNGMFSIAILDSINRQLIIARDAFGEKPLYIYQTDAVFAFASEVKALAETFNLRNDFNFDVIQNYLADGCNYSSESFFRGVKKLNAGMMAVIDFDEGLQVTLEKYPVYRPSTQINELPTNSNAIFAKLLTTSVEQRLDTDVETGIYLSGGLDSSAIAWIAKSLSPSVESFSVAFSEDYLNEANQAKVLANCLGMKNSQVMCDENYAISILDRISTILDEPMADPSIIPTTLLSEFASQKIKVALGGDGSDEIGYGYNTFNQFRKIDALRKILKPEFLDLGSQLIPSPRMKLKLALAAELMKSNSQVLVASATSPYFRYRFASSDNKDNMALKSGILEYSPAGLFQDELVDAYVSTYMKEQILIKIDRASMYSSVELRSPFLDYDLAAYMSRSDKGFKYSRGVGKLPLRAFLKGKVPDEILARPKKGFGIPLEQWMQGKFGELLLEKVLDGNWSGTSIESKHLFQLSKTVMRDKPNSAALEFLWSLAIFQIWRKDWS